MARNKYLYIVVFNLLTILALVNYWLVLLESHEKTRKATVNRMEQVAIQLSNGLSEQMAAVIRNVNFVSTVLIEDYNRNREHFEDSVNSAFRAFPENSLIQVGVIDRDGFLAYSNLGTANKQYLGDREHF